MLVRLDLAYRQTSLKESDAYDQEK
jgi:hypothetical protein